MTKKIKITEEDAIAVLTEWDRRYREEPERFQSEAVHLLKETPKTYGESSGPYFMMILRELRSDCPPPHI